MDSKPANQGKSVRRKKSGKGRKDMEGNNIPNKSKNSKETECKNQVSNQASQKDTKPQEKAPEKSELSKTSKEEKVSALPNKKHLENKTPEKISKCNDTKEIKGKKTTNLGDGFKDAIEKRNDEAEAGIHSLSKNMKYARRKKKTNEKIEDSWSKSFMQNTASFMVKGERKDDQINQVKELNKGDLKSSTIKTDLVSNKAEPVKLDETKNVSERTFCLLGSEKVSPESINLMDNTSQQMKLTGGISENLKNGDEEQKENKDAMISGTEKSTSSKENIENKEAIDEIGSSTEKDKGLKENNSQIKFPPYRSRFVSDSDSIKKFIKDEPKSEYSSKLDIEICHQKQESIITSIDMTKEISKHSDVHLCDVTEEEEDKSVKFFISDDESDSDTAIFVDNANTEAQDQDISDSDTAIFVDTEQSDSKNLYVSNADIKLIRSDDILSEKEPIMNCVLKTNETCDKENIGISENKDLLNNDLCSSVKEETKKSDTSVVIDMIEDDSDIIRDIILENAAIKKNKTASMSSLECGASAIDKLFDDIIFDQKDKEDDMVESNTSEEKSENIMCFPWAGEETKEYQLDEVLKSTSDENQSKTCGSESNPERVSFAEPKSSEEKDESSKTDQSSKSISGFGRSYRNSQRLEGLSNSLTQEEFIQKEFSGNDTHLAEGKRHNTSGEDNMVCGAMSNNTNGSSNLAQAADNMSFLGITNKVNAPNINISVEEMEGELEKKTENYIKQKHKELTADVRTDVKSRNPFHPDNINNKNGNETIPFASAFETLASIKKSLLEAQENPFQNKLNELSGYTKIQPDEETILSKDCNLDNTQKSTSCSISPKSTPRIGDKIKEMLGIGHSNEENYSQGIKSVQQEQEVIKHIDNGNNDNLSNPSQNNNNQANLKTNECVAGSERVTNIESNGNVSQPVNSSIKETDEAVGKSEALIKSSKNVFNICDPRKITFSGINKKFNVDLSTSENQTHRPVNQKEGKCIKPLKKYSTRSMSQPVLVKTDGCEIISESDLLSKTKVSNESQNSRVKTGKPYLRRTMSQEKYEESFNQSTYPSKQQPTKAAEKVSYDIKKLKEPIHGPLPDKHEMDINQTGGDSKCIDSESADNNLLMTFSTDSPIIDHCNSSEMEAYTKYFQKFTHTSERFIQSLSDTTFESLEGENSKLPESGTINKGLWDQRKYDELNIPKNEIDIHDTPNEDYSSIIIFDDLCPDKWKGQCKEQCKEDANIECQKESSFRLENESGMKTESVPLWQATALENFDDKADHSTVEKQSQSSIRKQKVSWLLNEDSDVRDSQSAQYSKSREKDDAHTKPRRLHSPPPKLPTAIEINDADFDAAIMSPTTSDFNASGSLNTLLSKLSTADICMDKKYRSISKFSDHLHSGQQSKPPSFTSTLKVSERNYSSKDMNSETFKRPELVSTTIADWKVSSPVFSAELSLTPPANKNPNSIVSPKEPVHLAKSDVKITSTEPSTKTTEKLSSSMLTFTEKLSSIKKTSMSSVMNFTDKISGPSPENHLSTSLFSVSDKRPSVTPIQSPTGFKESSPDVSTHSTDHFSFSDILEDSRFKVDGVRSTKV